MLHLYGVMDSPLKHLFQMRNFKENEMCLFLGFTNGEKGFSKNCAKNVRRVARRFGGMSLTGYVTRGWGKGRFSDPYLRDTMQDFGIVTAPWSAPSTEHSPGTPGSAARSASPVEHNLHDAHSNVYPQARTSTSSSYQESTPSVQAKHSGSSPTSISPALPMSHHHGSGRCSRRGSKSRSAGNTTSARAQNALRPGRHHEPRRHARLRLKGKRKALSGLRLRCSFLCAPVLPERLAFSFRKIIRNKCCVTIAMRFQICYILREQFYFFTRRSDSRISLRSFIGLHGVRQKLSRPRDRRENRRNGTWSISAAAYPGGLRRVCPKKTPSGRPATM
jgi:hypothetical protein